MQACACELPAITPFLFISHASLQKASGKNLYLIKPKDTPDVSFGTETGRMTGQDVRSSMQHMGETFWCFSQLDALIPDLSRVVLIELEDAWTEDSIQFASN